MKKLLTCELDMDTSCVELRYSDGSMISIGCAAVEDKLANSRLQKSELDWLIYSGIDSERRPEKIFVNRSGTSIVK